MTVWKRAWYYVSRKKEKSIVMMVILITIMILLNTVLVMQKEMNTKKREDDSAGIVLQQQDDETSQQTKDEILQQFADEANAKSLEEGSRTMKLLFRIMVFVLAAMSVLILSFLLVFRIRERKYEIGVMVSVGRPKKEILGQFLAEILYLMGASLPLALGISWGILKALGYSIQGECLGKALGIWGGSIVISLTVASIGILTKKAKTILVQID